MASVPFSNFQDSSDDVTKQLNFLVSDTGNVGFTYQGTQGDLKDKTLPLSYYSTPDYFAKYVGTLPGNNLTVVDQFNPNDYTLMPTKDSPGGDLQVERVNVYYGTDIYDASCWQIALGLCGKAGLSGPSGQDLFDLADNQNTLLKVGYDGNADTAQLGANRAVTTSDCTFLYNGEPITNPPQAYTYRMVTRNWLSKDPFYGTEYMKYITAKDLPSQGGYEAGKITWSDWKPITGENGWAFFIGPLQAEYLKMQKTGATSVPFTSTAVQNALNTLHALRCMQSEIGGIYYACQGSLGNQGDQPVNPYEVSVENNASSLGGLFIFQGILQGIQKNATSLTCLQKTQVANALNAINIMINGGPTPQGKQTEGLLAFFQKYAFNKSAGIFYQGGLANDPSQSSTWIPTTEPKAVDVSTWGVSALGQDRVDSWFGFGAAYNIWKDVKSWGGFYGPDGKIWGVGYSDKDGNGVGADYKKGIMSAEWTAGAINMLRCLIAQYKAAHTNPKYSTQQQQDALQYATELQQDHDSMNSHLISLRTDNYPTEAAFSTVAPPSYSSLVPIPSDKLAYLYASKRYMIPFGWFANPVPSVTSTSWALMLNYNFNPLVFGGGYTPIATASEF